MQPDIVCLGEPLLEFNQDPGDGRYLQGHGGDTSNAAIAAARQGARVGYVTAVGADPFGQSFLDLWAAEGVDTSHVKRTGDAPTGIYFVSHGAEGHVFSYYRAGSAASRLPAADLPREYLTGARLFHASGISQAIGHGPCDAVFEAMEMAREAGVLVSYDTNLRLRLWPLKRAKATIHAALAMADIALPGLDDARHLTGLEDPDAIADFYLRLGPQVVALTLGPVGTLVATPERRERVPSIKVKPVDATGAGDVFDGAFLAEYLNTGDPFAAGRYANAAAALSTEGYGAVAPIPRRAQVQAALASAAAVPAG